MTTADDITMEEAILRRLDELDLKLNELLAKPTRSPRPRQAPASSYTADQLDALAIDAIGNVQFDVRKRVDGRWCEVSRKALFNYLTEKMELTREDAYAVNAHIATRPQVEEFTVRRSVFFRWPEEAELFTIQPDAEVVELKPAARKLLP